MFLQVDSVLSADGVRPVRVDSLYPVWEFVIGEVGIQQPLNSFNIRALLQVMFHAK